MATFKIPRLVGKTNAAGLTSWYWQPSATLRAKGHRPQLLGQHMGDVAPPEVVDACRLLNDKIDGGMTPQVKAAIARLQPLTLGDAIDRYVEAGCPSVKRPGEAVAASTQKQYKAKLRTLRAWGGDVRLSSITDERVARLRDALMKPAAGGQRIGEVRHHHAHETLRVGRTLFSWLEKERLTPKGSNPFAAFGLATPGPRDQIWSAAARDELALACQVATVGEDGRPTKTADLSMAVAIDLAFSIGQREADLLKLLVSQYVEIPHFKMDPEVWEALAETTEGAPGLVCGGAPRKMVTGIRLRQGKTRRWIEVPVVGATRRRIEAQIEAAKAAKSMLLLLDGERPWTEPNLEAGQTRFIRRFGEIRAAAMTAATQRQEDELAAEIATLQFRDFRRTAVVFLGELGLADHLIAAITGHSLDETKRILETYMPRTTGMAARAIALSRARAPAPAEQEKQNG